MLLSYKTLFSFLVCITLTSCGQVGKETKTKDTQKPNIVFIIADDMRKEYKTYGVDAAITPNLSRLAGNGIQFNRAYCQQAVCSASRASFFSSLRPDVAGCDYPYSEYYVNELIDKHPTMFRCFAENGYELITMGKLHHGLVEKEQVNHNDFRTQEYYDPENQKRYENTPGGRSQKVKQQLPYELADMPEEVYDDYKMGQAAIETIKKYAEGSQENPFFMGIGFWKPHAPYVAPAKYAENYKVEDIELSPSKDNVPPNIYSLPSQSVHLRYIMEEGYTGRKFLEGRDCSDERAREVIRAYLACINFIDAQVGRIIDALEETGLDNNTIIVFTSDHGYHLGDHLHWGKTTNYEVSTKVPLLVVDPRAKVKGIQSDALVEMVDIYPSLIEMAGYQVDEFMEGTSFKPLVYNERSDWKTAAFSQFPRWGKSTEGFSVRTDIYRYTEWYHMDGTEKDSLLAIELYDEVNDTHEMTDLSEIAEYQLVKEEMKKILDAGWKNALPKGVTNNSNNPKAPVAVKVDYDGDVKKK